MFGETLLTKSGEKPTDEVLGGKAGVLVYFSAHWCPPCRGFTPKLSEFHKKHSAAKNFETVFVSSDKDQGAFDEYYGEMPFTALPFSKRDLKGTLSTQYKVNGIPTLVVLGPDGELITANGRDKVMADFDECANFPWTPLTLDQALGDKLQKKDGSLVDTKAALAGKTVGIYFSAHWCPPCRKFTPELAKFYEAYKKTDPNFEIIFSSGDKTSEEAESYFKEDHGAYLMLPFANRKGATALDELFEVEGIPTFVIVKDGKLVNAEGKAKVSAGVEAVIASGWEPPLVGDLAEGPSACGVDINSAKTVVAILHGLPADRQQTVEKELAPLAQKAKDAKSPPETIFLVSKAGGGVMDQVGALIKKNGGPRCESLCSDGKPLIVMFDIPSGGKYHVMEEDYSAAAVDAFTANPGEQRQLEK